MVQPKKRSTPYHLAYSGMVRDLLYTVPSKNTLAPLLVLYQPVIG